MVQQTETRVSEQARSDSGRPPLPYDQWIASLGVPVHRGYYAEDVRTLELGWWEERGCQTAFLQLAGQQGVSEARVSEIAPGVTLPAQRFGFDEAIYVADGRGLTTVWGADGSRRKTFEWQKHSLFLLPHNRAHQLANAQGDRPARLLHFNYLPVAMSLVADPDFHFGNPFGDLPKIATPSDEYYSEAKVEHDTM